MSIQIRAAQPDDAAVLYEMIVELADFEKAKHEVQSSPDLLRKQLKSVSPPFECLLATDGVQVTGFALFFYSYSTWRAKKGVWLEDLYVRASHRKQGIGSQLFDAVLKLAEAQNAGRLEWPVLEWNINAHEFYRSKGALPLTEWRTWRLSLP